MPSRRDHAITGSLAGFPVGDGMTELKIKDQFRGLQMQGYGLHISREEWWDCKRKLIVMHPN